MVNVSAQHKETIVALVLDDLHFVDGKVATALDFEELTEKGCCNRAPRIVTCSGPTEFRSLTVYSQPTERLILPALAT